MKLTVYEDISDIIKKAPIEEEQKQELLEKLKSDNLYDTQFPSAIATGHFDYSVTANAMLWYIFKNFDKIDENYELYDYMTDDNGYVLDTIPEYYGVCPKLELNVAEILREMGIASSGDNRKMIRDAFKELRDKSIWIRYKDKNDEFVEETFAVLKKVRAFPKERTITIFFEEREYQIIKLCQKSWYAKYMFSNFALFSSAYTQRIFAMICADLWKTNKYSVSNKELNKRLKTKFLPSEMKYKVIEPSINEMNNKVKVYHFENKTDEKNKNNFIIETSINNEEINKLYDKYIGLINEKIGLNNSENEENTPFLVDYKTIKEEEQRKEQEKKERLYKAEELNNKLNELTKKEYKFRADFNNCLKDFPMPLQVYYAIIDYLSTREIITSYYIKKIVENCYKENIETKEEFKKRLEFLKEKSETRQIKRKPIKTRKGQPLKNQKEPDNWTRDYAFLTYYDNTYIDNMFQPIRKTDEEMTKLWKEWREKEKTKESL